MNLNEKFNMAFIYGSYSTLHNLGYDYERLEFLGDSVLGLICHSGDTIEDVARMMRKFDISCLPIVDEDMKVLGLITTDQISNLLS